MSTADNGHVPIEETEVFKLFVRLSNQVWRRVKRWQPFDRDTVGKQLVRAADRIGATLVEGDGRFGDNEAIQFFHISRASARETQYWLTVSCDRGLIPDPDAREMASELRSGARQLSGLINYRLQFKATMVRETQNPYDFGIFDSEPDEERPESSTLNT